MNDTPQAETRLSKVGRPLKFSNVRTLQRKIDDYLQNCTELGKMPTITGLAVALDTDRRTLIEYADRPEFTNAIKRAKAIIESELEDNALRGKTNPAVSIFSLKNNYGWHDKVEVQATNLNANVELDPATAEAFTKYLDTL